MRPDGGHIGVLAFRDGAPHAGVLLIDDLGDAAEEAVFLVRALSDLSRELETGAFMRAGLSGYRRASASDR